MVRKEFGTDALHMDVVQIDKDDVIQNDIEAKYTGMKTVTGFEPGTIYRLRSGWRTIKKELSEFATEEMTCLCLYNPDIPEMCYLYSSYANFSKDWEIIKHEPEMYEYKVQITVRAKPGFSVPVRFKPGKYHDLIAFLDSSIGFVDCTSIFQSGGIMNGKWGYVEYRDKCSKLIKGWVDMREVEVVVDSQASASTTEVYRRKKKRNKKQE